MATTMFSGGVTEPAVVEEATPPAPVPTRPITTDAGRYLRAAARGESLTRYSVTGDAAVRVWEIAFGLAARRRFEPATPLAEVGRSVSAALRERCAAAVPPLDAEMLVRAALGEAVPLEELDSARRILVHLLLFAAFTDELALGDNELDTLIAEAEELAAAG
jgi:hypothetical protein